MTDKMTEPAHGPCKEAAPGEKACLPGARRRVRMTRAPGQALVLSSLGGPAGDAGPIEICFSAMGTGGAATLDFLLPDHFFVEHKEIMDGMQTLFEQHHSSPCGLDD